MRNLALAVFSGAAAFATLAHADQAITANSTVQGRLERGDARVRDDTWRDTYTYQGEAGEEIRLWRTPGFHGLRIEGPASFVQDTNSHAMNVRLPHRGRYRIIIEGHAGDYQLFVWRVRTDQPTQALSAGQTIEGALTTTDPERQDTYTYTARAGEAAVFRFEGQHRSYMALRVTGADGRERYRAADPGATGEVFVNFGVTGEYQVLVSGDGGNYTLSMQTRPTSAVARPTGHLIVGDATELSYSAEAAISELDRPTLVYTFDARRGDRLAVVRSRQASTKIRGPDGQLVQTNWTRDEETLVSSDEFTAPTTGLYRVEAEIWPTMVPAESTLRLVSREQGAALIADARARGERQRAERQARIAQLLQRGEQLLSSGANEQAVQVFREVQTIDPSNVNAKVGDGVALFRMGHYTAASWAFESALADDPNNRIAAENLAAARQAEATQQRDQRLAYEQQQQERSQVVSNAIGAFVGAYTAAAEAEQARLQAEANAAAQAQAAARAREQAQPSASRPPQQSGSSPPSGSGPMNPTVRGPGSNTCAEVVGVHIYNRCDFAIMVATSHVYRGRTETEVQFIGVGQNGVLGQGGRLLVSCNHSHSPLHGAFLTANGGAECR